MLLGIPGHTWKTTAVKHVLYVMKQFLSYASVTTFLSHHDSGSSRGEAVLPFISVLGGFEIAHGGDVLQRLSFLPNIFESIPLQSVW